MHCHSYTCQWLFFPLLSQWVLGVRKIGMWIWVRSVSLTSVTTAIIIFCGASKSSLYIVIFVGKAKKPLATQKFVAKYRGEICVGKGDFSDDFHEKRHQMYSFPALSKCR